MSRLTDSLSADVDSVAPRGGAVPPIKRALEGKHVCPFCGTVNTRTDEPCPSCGMENTPATRNSTRGRVGPWYVLQKRNPAAPGMKYDTLIKFIRKGRIQPRAIVRGPTTSQLWRFAVTVKGVSREFGVCYNCGGDIEVIADTCPLCSRDQRPPADPNALLETTVAPAPPKLVKPQPAMDDVDLRDETNFGEAPAAPAKPSPRAASPTQRPAVPMEEAFSPAAFNGGALVPKQEQPRFPDISRDERERREIEDAREKRDAEPRDPSKTSPTLSARELATAFQLDFTPANSKRRGGKSRKVLILFILLLLLGGAGTAAWFFVPQAHDAMLSAYRQANVKIQAMMNPAPPPATEPSIPTINNFSFQATPSSAAPVATTPTSPANQIAPNATATPSQPETPAPAPIKPAVVTPPAPAMTLDEAYDASRKLWRQALDSEAAGDYAAAVVAFEKIKALPAKAQPSALDMRLTEAKAKLGK